MKKICYNTEYPKAQLVITVPSDINEEKLLYECDVAYSAWCDIDENDPYYINMPEYIERCLDDALIDYIMIEYQEV